MVDQADHLSQESNEKVYRVARVKIITKDMMELTFLLCFALYIRGLFRVRDPSLCFLISLVDMVRCNTVLCHDHDLSPFRDRAPCRDPCLCPCFFLCILCHDFSIARAFFDDCVLYRANVIVLK